MNVLRAVLPCLALALCAACYDNPAGPVSTHGSVRFVYSSDNSPLGGAYLAGGEIPDGAGDADTWAGGMLDAQSGGALVFGFQDRGDDVADVASLTLSGATPGEYPVLEDCNTARCATLQVSFGQPQTGDGPEQWACVLSTGTVRVTGAAGGRLQGEFQGAGSCSSATNPNLPRLAVSQGRFDVALADLDL